MIGKVNVRTLTCYVEIWRDGEWQLVGQYPTRHQANLIAKDYRSRGEKVRVRQEK